jgi:hypothetical protein
MALRAGEIRGNRSVVQRLMVPRPLTHWLLLVAGAAAGEVCWRFLSPSLLAYLSGTLAPFCLLCAGAVWAMRDKLDSVLDGEHMDAETFSRTLAKASQERRRFMLRSARVAVCSLVAASAAIAQQLAGGVWHWMPIAAGLAVADSAFSYLLADGWEEQLRAFKAQRVVAAKRMEERRALEARIEQRSDAGPQSAGSWTHADAGQWTAH